MTTDDPPRPLDPGLAVLVTLRAFRDRRPIPSRSGQPDGRGSDGIPEMLRCAKDSAQGECTHHLMGSASTVRRAGSSRCATGLPFIGKVGDDKAMSRSRCRAPRAGRNRTELGRYGTGASS